MRLNNKGFVIEGAALVIIAVMALFILPQNPISGALGIGVRPNKTVQTEKVELIKDAQGVPYAYKTTSSEKEEQQHVTFFEWVRSNIILVILAFLFLLATGGLGKAWSSLKNVKKAARQIVVGVDKALDNIHDDATKQKILDKLDGSQDESTKKLVDSIQGK